MSTDISHTEHLQTAKEAEARRIAAEEWQRKLAQSNREAAEAAERFSTDEQERHAANAKALRILVEFLKVIQDARPTREQHGFGPQLNRIIARGLHDLVGFYHSQINNHYDARKDIGGAA